MSTWYQNMFAFISSLSLFFWGNHKRFKKMYTQCIKYNLKMDFTQNNPKSVYHRLNSAFHFAYDVFRSQLYAARWFLFVALRRLNFELLSAHTILFVENYALTSMHRVKYSSDANFFSVLFGTREHRRAITYNMQKKKQKFSSIFNFK